jgi:hypothetical protein
MQVDLVALSWRLRRWTHEWRRRKVLAHGRLRSPNTGILASLRTTTVLLERTWR